LEDVYLYIVKMWHNSALFGA